MSKAWSSGLRAGLMLFLGCLALASWVNGADAGPRGRSAASKPGFLATQTSNALSLARHDGSTSRLDREAAGQSPGSPTPSIELAGQPLIIDNVELFDGGQQFRAVRQARALDPAVIAAKRASRSRYRSLSASQAERLASVVFPGTMTEVEGGLPGLSPGSRVVGYPADNVATVVLPRGRHVAVESMTPIAAEGRHGRHAIDLRLAASGAGFAPQAAAVPVRIPSNLTGGVALARSDVSLRPVTSNGAGVASVGRSNGAVVVYPDTQASTDTVVKPTSSGFAIDSLLRAASSPQQLRFRLVVPAGDRVRQRRGGGPVMILRGKSLVAVIAAPTAQDAEGTTVPTTMRLAGSLLQVGVEHRSGSYRYPIELDPTVVENYEGVGNVAYGVTWGFFTESPSKFHAYNYKVEGGGAAEWECGQSVCTDVDDVISGTATTGERGFFYYRTQGLSKIYELTTRTRARSEGKGFEDVIGLVNVHTKGFEGTPARYNGDYPLTNTTVCALAECTPGTVTSSNDETEALFEQTVGEPLNGDAVESEMGRALVYIAQEAPPTAGFDTTDEKIGRVGDRNALYEGGWTNGSAENIGVNAFDPGIGVSKVRLASSSRPGWESTTHFGGPPNGIEQNDECHEKRCGGEPVTTAIEDGQFPNGEDPLEATVENPVGLTAKASTVIKVDNQGATLKLSGLPAHDELGYGHYRFAVEATEGVKGIPSSGVASVSALVDGKELGRQEGCSPGPCSSKTEWTLNGEVYAAGLHWLEVSAVTGAGVWTSTGAAITIHDAERKPVGPGSVELASGGYSLTAKDVSIGGPGDGLSVERSFSSRPMAVRTEGPFGEQWQGLAVGGTQSLTKLSTGSVVLTAAGGQQIEFAKESSGFVAPSGDANLTLKEESSGSYVLRDEHGDATTFAAPSGGSGNVFTPASREAVGSGGQATSYSFETVGGVVRLKQELAPVPHGVSCTTLVRGCRALSFTYASNSTATGEAPSEWGEYTGRLVSVKYTAYNPQTKAMETVAVAEYSYDHQGRLRAEWNPQIKPALKTTYGYNGEGLITAVSEPGQQPWLISYGSVEEPTRTQTQLNPGRVVAVTRPGPSTKLGEGVAPANTAAPTVTGTPTRGVEATLNKGTWANTPLAYSYQWERCSTSNASECETIPGAVDETYIPRYGDELRYLAVAVTATNAGGSTTVTTAPSAQVPATLFPEEHTEPLLNAGRLGAFKEPEAVAHSEAAKEYVVADTGNNRLVDLETEAALTSFEGKPLKEPTDVALSSGKAEITSPLELWATDQGNSRVVHYKQETPIGPFTEEQGISFATGGTLTGIALIEGQEDVVRISPTGNQVLCFKELKPCTKAGFGKFGVGNGQLAGPFAIAAYPQKKLLYVADSANDRIQYFTAGGSFKGKFGEAGSGPGQFKNPNGIFVDEEGHVFVADSGNNRIEEFTETGTFIQQFGEKGSGSGQFNDPRHLVGLYGGESVIADKGNNRLDNWHAGQRPEETPLVPTKPAPPGTSQVWTIDAFVPRSGSGAPYQMSKTEVERWGQHDFPVTATAIFPPDTPMGHPAESYKRATVYYLDEKDRTVNTASPGGAISTAEYNAANDVTRTLTPDNRATALEAGSNSAAVSSELDTENSYSSAGTQLEGTLGPKHTVKLANGESASAREQTRYFYEEGAPAGGPYGLLTKETVGAQTSSGERDVRTITRSYSGQGNLGWRLRKPTAITSAPSGLNLAHATLYEEENGQVAEARMPANTSGKSPHSGESIYYTAGTNSRYAACGERPEWAGLLCHTQPAKQPETAGLPTLKLATSTYNFWDEPTTTYETAGSSERTDTTTYDAAGRPVEKAVTGNAGAAIPPVAITYNKATGAAETESATIEGTKRTITAVFNSIGELSTYTDADGNTTSYTYDVDGRTETVNDGKGIRTYTYDSTTGFATQLTDSLAGTFTATYDLEGRQATESFPNGMVAKHGYNDVGQATSLEYVKTTHCSEKCVWFSDIVEPSIHGQWLTQHSSLSSQNYTYDEVGRLTQVQNTPAGKGCTTRIYAYDNDTNRLSQTTRPPNTDGTCATSGGTVESHHYDEADRLTDPGTHYNDFGDITALPAGDAGGGEITSSFYADNQLQRITQHEGGSQPEETIGYNLDPAGRTRETVATGNLRTADTISHFSGPGSEPAWTTNVPNGEWSRNVSGLSGNLVAVQANAEAPVLQLANLHGDVIATAYSSETATALASTADTSEYGVPTNNLPPKYAWMGAIQIPTELSSGTTNMGARAYEPDLGRFLQPDPIEGGSANAYAYTYGDPVNRSDPSGAYTIGGPSAALIEVAGTVANETIALDAAARREAECKAKGYTSCAALEQSEAEIAAERAANAALEPEEWEEWEEWEEEEGEYWEYVSNNHDKGSGSEEVHLEPAVFYQPLLEAGSSEPAEHTPSRRCSAERGSDCTQDVLGRPHPGKLHRESWWKERNTSACYGVAFVTTVAGPEVKVPYWAGLVIFGACGG